MLNLDIIVFNFIKSLINNSYTQFITLLSILLFLKALYPGANKNAN